MNFDLEEVGKIAKINNSTIGRLNKVIRINGKDVRRKVKKERPKWMYISTHIGRRGFTTNHYGKIPTPLIMKVTDIQKNLLF